MKTWSYLIHLFTLVVGVSTLIQNICSRIFSKCKLKLTMSEICFNFIRKVKKDIYMGIETIISESYLYMTIILKY